MGEVEGGNVGPVRVLVEPSAASSRNDHDHRSKRLTYTVEGGDKHIYRILQQMRAESGLSLRALAERMGIRRDSLNQYFWQRRGGGSSRLGWFLRFAEACGCRVWLTFPSLKEQVELKTKYYLPPGNPNWKKKPNETK